MLIKLDDNKYPIQETASRKPLQEVATVSVASGGSDTATVSIPDNEIWFITSWQITKGADITVDSIKVDGDDTYEIADVADTQARYGSIINGENSVSITGSNSALSAETLEIKVNGYKIAF